MAIAPDLARLRVDRDRAGTGLAISLRMTSFEHRAPLAQDPTAAVNAAALLVTIQELHARLTALEEENTRLREQSTHDELTGIHNRRAFQDALERALQYRRRYGGAVAVIALDLDGMKKLNDTYGHPAGDTGLRAVGEILRRTLRSTDLAARLGGDEFAILLPNTGAGGAAHVAERLRAAIEAIPMPKDARLTASIGVATTERASPSITRDGLWARADSALYAAKRNGRNRVEIELYEAGADHVRATERPAERAPEQKPKRDAGTRAAVLARIATRAR